MKSSWCSNTWVEKKAVWLVKERVIKLGREIAMLPILKLPLNDIKISRNPSS